MKILVVAPFFDRSASTNGPITFLHSTTQRLVDAGHQVSVVTSHRVPRFDEKPQPTFREKEYFRILDWPFAPSVVKRLYSRSADVAHCHIYQNLLTIAATAVLAKRRIPFVLSTHGYWTPFQFFRRLALPVFDNFAIRFVRCARKIIVTSHTEAKEFLRLGISPDALEVIWGGIDKRIFQDIRRRETESERSILFVGRLVKRKRCDIAIRTMSILRKQFNDARLLVAGDGPELANMQALARRLGLQECVEFLGKVNYHDLITLYTKCHLLLLPADQEGMPIALLESLASGCPAVVGMGGGMPEVGRLSGGAAVLCSREPKDFATSIAKLLREENLRFQMARQGKNWVMTNCTWDQVTEKLVQLYELELR